MKKLSLADRMAKKSFESPKFQQSWAVHMAAFGPILEPAFADNYQAKVHLTAALNLISSRQLAQGLDKLNQIQKFCETDADKAAFLFFLGVYFELSGDREHMAEFYCAANEYGHALAMPYIKAGKYFLENHAYEQALEQYRGAVGCYTTRGLSDQDKIVLGSVQANIATCLLMMHRYEEAEAALNTSRSLCADAPGRSAVEAALYALRGERNALQNCLDTLQQHAPEVYEAVKESTDRILSGTDPLFFALPLDEGKITAFWAWFTDHSAEIHALLEEEKYEEAMEPVGEQLLAAFPFLEEAPYIALGQNEEGYVLELHDCYAVAIADAYGKLLSACPEEMHRRWQFVVVH